MSASLFGVFALAVPSRHSALIADTVTASADQSQKALAACGATAFVLTDASEADRIVRDRRPDLVIVDLNFGGRHQGLAVADLVLRISDAAVIVIGDDFGAATQALLSDRCHILQRPIHNGQLRTTISVALERRGRRSQGASHDATLRKPVPIRPEIEPDRAPTANWSRPNVSFERLRPRERQIVDLLLQHFRVPAVASSLGISAHTVRNHLKNIYRRFGLRSQQELLRAMNQDR